MKWIGGLCLMAVLVGAAATMTTPAATVAPDMEILKLFPQDTQGIAVIDAAALRNAALVQEFLNDHEARFPSQLAEFAQATGIMPQRDVDQVMAGKIGSRQVLAIVRARFDRLKLEQFMREKNVAAETYQGWQIYRPGKQADDPVIGIVDNLLMLGHDGPVRGAIERKAAPGPSVADNAEVMKAINSIEAGNQIWAAGRFTAADLPLPRRRPAQADEILKALEGGTYQMRIDQDVHVRATGDFNNAENAKNVADMLRGFLGLAKIQLAQQEDFSRFLDGVRLDVEGNSAVVSFDAPGDLIRRLHQSKPRLGN